MIILNDLTKEKIQTPLKTIKVGTLGPSGTSSEFAANLFMDNYLFNQGIFSELILFQTFEESMENLEKGLLDYIIVPHAYGGINEFYMKSNIDLIQLFRCDTPMYGLAVRKGFPYHKELLDSETIVSHPAPINLLKYFLNTNAKIHTVNSTSVAASLVKESVYNIAITNEVAKQKYDLDFVYQFKNIPMSWSVFGRR
ncbi:prephenate dehydratase domain-containing protein [Priestia aryabhattai]|uniref:prephenate dehydratase domain-containing protein n=1 Tax=Priestia aryabhattai TaxID=412384 RepID=UPI001875CC02|nr:prephenate dehydratase domain-containing protein [Priestia aryabhattai]MBE5101503.1 bacilysin biosynthesis protein BacA [Priestia aryabhattai]